MYYMILSILFPICTGVYLLVRRDMESRKNLLIVTGAFFVVSAVLVILTLCITGNGIFTLFSLTDRLPILFRIDEVSVVFSVMTIVVVLCAGFFSFVYMKHEEKEKRYYGYYLIVLGVLVALCFAGNLITFYLFFELLTLSSMPLVLHNGSREAIMAGLKYLFYSLSGAYMSLFGLYFLERYGNTLTFSAGGVISAEMAAQHGELLLGICFAMLIGFGVKAGMFPMHAWLPTAHPVAPAPASAVLSAVIVKAGVLAIVRVVYYIYGASFLRGSWVQYTWMILTLITVFMGSMLAYREQVLKKRLAYSTVSQLSYILFGFAVMDGGSVTGGLLHVLCHGFIKAALFLCTGGIIYMTGKTRVEQLRGIGKEMPLLMWCYTIVSLGLIGIPPTGGFISKWYLAQGTLSSGIPGFSWIGPAVLLISALLTAGYLLPLTIQGFFPGTDYDYSTLKKKEPPLIMTVPILILTVLSVEIGLFPQIFINYLLRIVEKII
ncbi:complex I subunit 5 family protein [Parablautia muri]|uniref:Proton-conducting membrane transporter n=1 Tax=Parablautia muri TaxID=2320879 RepID=A0A9X5BC80_9FIRM|nr:proton-conducting transporter membrane subunit [Parablautia muri]NBJ91056.1 proton-conducting membrane transporter [Parablautia muri]